MPTSCAERKRQLLTTGLMLASPFGRFRRPVAAISSDEPVGIHDVVIVAVRAQNYETALKLAATAIGPETAVAPVIEGADHNDALMFGPRVAAAVERLARSVG